MKSRFIAPIAKEAAYLYDSILTLGAIIFVAGVWTATLPGVMARQGANLVLFAVLLFSIPLLVTFMLKSFRKSLAVVAPALIAIAVVPLAAYAMRLKLAGLDGLYASLIFPVACGVNYMITRDYFFERRRPTTSADAIFQSFSRFSQTVLGSYIMVVFTFLAISAFTTPEMASLGMVTAFAALASLFASVLVLPAAILFYEHRRARKALDAPESDVLNYVESFGDNEESIPFFASWLGTAADDVERMVESLRSKGFIGQNFFSFDDPLVWFLLYGTLVLGGTLAKSVLPRFDELSQMALLLTALTLGVCMESPQGFPYLDRPVRKIVGYLLLIGASWFAANISGLMLEAFLVMAILGLLASKVGNKPYWMVANFAVGLFYSTAFVVGWSLFDNITLTPKLWAIGITIVIFLVQLIVEEEQYVTLEAAKRRQGR